MEYLTVAQRARWDVSDPEFLLTILYVMLALGVVTVAGGLLLGAGFDGLLSGALLAVLLYLATLQAGKIFNRTRNFTLVMLWLLGAQTLLWVGMAVLLGFIGVDGVGFAFGVSILPVSVILTTFYWWLVKNKGTL